jgi:23S rRNA (adenine2503-C2)-methyltransferase
MRLIGSTGNQDLATAYVAELRDGRYIEFVESVQPPLPRSEKWVLIVSTMFGCPIGCPMCDAGGHFMGNLTANEILAQIDFLVRRRFPDRPVDSKKFKIQFARMGEPSLNIAVLDVLRELPGRYSAPGLIPSVSSVAPVGSESFFAGLLDLKGELYRGGGFQLQFSIHTTDDALRRELIPAKTWSLERIAAYGKAFFERGDRKITLNSALPAGMPLAPEVLRAHFDPARFVIKMTPLNPTYRAAGHELTSYLGLSESDDRRGVVRALRQAGFDVIVSIGEPEENLIGSNCGQYVLRHLRAGGGLPGAYTYDFRSLQADHLVS